MVIVSDDAQPATASALLAAGFTRSPFAWIEPTSTTSVQVGEDMPARWHRAIAARVRREIPRRNITA